MTNDYAIVLPLMLAIVVCQFVTHGFVHDNLYSGWLRRRGELLEHGASRDVPAGLRVADAMDENAVVVGEGEPVAALLNHIGHSDQGLFPVVDDRGRYLGVLTTSDLGAVTRAGGTLDRELVAIDVATNSETLTPKDSLLQAIRRMGVRGFRSLPVIDVTGRLVGVVSRSGILSPYERSVAGIASPASSPRSRAAAGSEQSHHPRDVDRRVQ